MQSARLDTFVVDFAPAALRDLKRLDQAVRGHLLKASGILTHAPYPAKSERIKVLIGVTPIHFRLRVGDYRMVYRVEDQTVVVVRVAHRREAYR